jgi:hypothetical protein
MALMIFLIWFLKAMRREWGKEFAVFALSTKTGLLQAQSSDCYVIPHTTML